MQPNGKQPNVVTRVIIDFLEGGQIMSGFQGNISRPHLNMLIATAHQDLLVKIAEEEAKQIKVPTDVRIPNLRGDEGG